MIKVLLLMVLLTTTVQAENYFTAVVGGTSVHIEDGYDDFDGTFKKFNNSHNLLGIEYRNIDYGVTVLRFENSYFDTSYMLTGSKYYQPIDNVEVIVSTGIVSGYTNRPACIVALNTMCAIVAIGIQLDTPIFKPRITWYGTAFVLTLTMEF
mgnify:FL=1